MKYKMTSNVIACDARYALRERRLAWAALVKQP